MESVSKKSGKRFTGKLAVIMHRIGAADLADESEPPKKVVVKPTPPKKTNAPKPKSESKPRTVKPKVEKKVKES